VADFLAGLAERVASLSSLEAAVARRAFRALLEGRASSLGALGVPDLAPGVVAAAIDRLRELGMLRLDPAGGAVVHARGLSARATRHALRLGRQTLYANCAVDALGIPAALAVDAAVDSHCRACRAPIALGLKAGAVTSAPDGLVIWAPDFDPSRPLDLDT